jgi:low affinity Fe/Cu permease
MSERQRNEKGEKEEKEEEKRGEKQEKEEKSWDEKWRRDPLSAVVWAGILIWAGLVLLVENMGFLARFERLEAWALIFVGAGLIVLLEVVVRLLVPSYRRPVTGSLIFGIILLAIGLGNLVSWGAIWALALIIIGLSILVRGFLWRR